MSTDRENRRLRNTWFEVSGGANARFSISGTTASGSYWISYTIKVLASHCAYCNTSSLIYNVRHALDELVSIFGTRITGFDHKKALRDLALRQYHNDCGYIERVVDAEVTELTPSPLSEHIKRWYIEMKERNEEMIERRFQEEQHRAYLRATDPNYDDGPYWPDDD